MILLHHELITTLWTFITLKLLLYELLLHYELLYSSAHNVINCYIITLCAKALLRYALKILLHYKPIITLWTFITFNLLDYEPLLHYELLHVALTFVVKYQLFCIWLSTFYLSSTLWHLNNMLWCFVSHGQHWWSIKVT